MTKEMLREVLYQEIEHYHTDSLSKDGQVSRTLRPSQPLWSGCRVIPGEVTAC